MRKLLAASLAALLLLCACSPVGHVKSTEPLPDEVFEEKNVFSQELYVPGLYVSDGMTLACDASLDSPMRSLALPLRFGCAYTAEAKSACIMRAAVCSFDPAGLGPGEEKALPDGGVLLFGNAFSAEERLSYVPKASGEWLVLFLSESGEQPELYLGECMIFAGEDPSPEWWTPEGVTDAFGNADSFADYKWNAEQIMQNLFEVLREKYPDYVTATVIGTDQSEQYEIPAYYFTPKEYDKTLIVVAGVHGTDAAACFALFKILESICAEKGGNAGLSYIRSHVRIVAVPFLNVWATYNAQHMRNSENVDLAIDFENVSQSETRSLCGLLRSLKGEKCVLLNLSCYNKWQTTASLYYTCSAPGRPAFFRTVNRIYMKLSERGLAEKPADTSHLMLGAWDVRTLEGCAERFYGIPAYGAYHSLDNFTRAYSAESMSTAVECFGNIAIAITADR